MEGFPTSILGFFRGENFWGLEGEVINIFLHNPLFSLTYLYPM